MVKLNRIFFGDSMPGGEALASVRNYKRLEEITFRAELSASGAERLELARV